MNKLVIVISLASFKEEGDACPAVVEVNHIRLFSLPPKDEMDAKRINGALAYAAVMTT